MTQINIKSGLSSEHPDHQANVKNQGDQYDNDRDHEEFKAGESLKSNNGRDTVLGEARNTARLSNKSALSKGTHVHPNEMMN
jgi:hypothetical protein